MWVVDSVGPKEACVVWGAHWRNLTNTTEPSVCGGDVAFCQLTLTTCYSLHAANVKVIAFATCYHCVVRVTHWTLHKRCACVLWKNNFLASEKLIITTQQWTLTTASGKASEMIQNLSRSVFGRPLQVTVRPMPWCRCPICL